MTFSAILSICFGVFYMLVGHCDFPITTQWIVQSFLFLIINLQSSKLQKLEVASGWRGVSSCSLLSKLMAFVLLCSSSPDFHPTVADDSLGSESSRLEPPIRNQESGHVFSTAERKSNSTFYRRGSGRSVDVAKPHSVHVTKTSGVSMISWFAQNYRWQLVMETIKLV